MSLSAGRTLQTTKLTTGWILSVQDVNVCKPSALCLLLSLTLLAQLWSEGVSLCSVLKDTSGYWVTEQDKDSLRALRLSCAERVQETGPAGCWFSSAVKTPAPDSESSSQQFLMWLTDTFPLSLLCYSFIMPELKQCTLKHSDVLIQAGWLSADQLDAAGFRSACQLKKTLNLLEDGWRSSVFGGVISRSWTEKFGICVLKYRPALIFACF